MQQERRKKEQRRRKLPIEERESGKWLKSYRALAAVQARLNHMTLVSVADREADLYDFFREATKDPKGPKLLVLKQARMSSTRTNRKSKEMA